MLTGIWNSVAGYVIIEIKGKGLERFLNLAVHSGIEIWRVRRTGVATITARVSVEGFYALRTLVRGQNVHVCILEKRGLIMRLSRLAFPQSAALWMGNRAGASRSGLQAHLVHRSGKAAIRYGRRKYSLRSILWKFALAHGATLCPHPNWAVNSWRPILRIAWAGARLDGVTLRVSLQEAEAIPQLPSGGQKTPVSIYAAKDGVITSITVYDGKAKVHVGDAVLAGQELITGVLRSDETHTLLTQARGEVMATVLYRFQATVGPTITKPVETGETRICARIGLFGWEFLSSGFAAEDAWENAREEPTFQYALTNCFLPFTAERIRLYELAERETSATQDELAQAALRKAERVMSETLSENARILSKESGTVWLEDGALQASILVTTEENIGEIKEIKEPHGEQD